jgi:hypothetical protein
LRPPDAHNDLGGLLFRQGRLRGARAEFTAAERINPAFAEAHAALESGRQAQGGLGQAGPRRGDRQR